MKGFRIGVVGSGAIGIYYGGRLAAAGSDVHFLIRGNLTEIRRDGLRIRGKDDDIHVAKVNCSSSTGEIGICDLVLVAVKTTSNADLVDLIPPLLHEGTMLLTLQNGLGNEEFLAKHFGAERVLGGLCFIAVDRHSKTEVERYAYGQVIVGEFGRPAQPRTHAVGAEFTRAGVQCSVANDIALERWRKLIWNIPFNGLSILAGGIDTAAIVGDKNLRELTLALMEEVISAANKCGHPLPEDAWCEHMKRSEMMGGYKPSTLQDFEAGKPLEIEAIWGEPLRCALAVDASVPRLEILYSLLKSVDRVRQSATKIDNRK